MPVERDCVFTFAFTEKANHAMQLAVNYSPAAAELFRAGRLDVDLFKCPPWPDLIEAARAHRPVYVHFPLKAGRAEPVALDGAAQWLVMTETPHVNAHLEPQVRPEAGALSGPEEATERTLRDVRLLAATFGADRVVVENVPYAGLGSKYDPLVADPGFIRRSVQETGCGFLLDLAHARIAAEALSVDVREYVSLLPVERLRELHVTGVHTHEGQRRDHLPMTEADWELFEWALQAIHRGRWGTPRIVAFEYGGVGEKFVWRTDPVVLAEQIPGFRRRMRQAAAQVVS